MMKSILSTVAVAATLLSATMAQAQGRIIDRFYHKASGYTVVVRDAPRDGRVLEGVQKVTGEKFVMHVTAAGKVTGDFEGKPVSFTVTDSGKIIQDSTEIASK
jgi:hypothetical protein